MERRSSRATIAAVCLLAWSTGARAETLRFTAAENSDFGVAANWSPSTVPGPGDTAFVIGYSVDVRSDARVAELVVGARGMVVIREGATLACGTVKLNQGTVQGAGVLLTDGAKKSGRGPIILSDEPDPVARVENVRATVQRNFVDVQPLMEIAQAQKVTDSKSIENAELRRELAQQNAALEKMKRILVRQQKELTSAHKKNENGLMEEVGEGEVEEGGRGL